MRTCAIMHPLHVELETAMDSEVKIHTAIDDRRV